MRGGLAVPVCHMGLLSPHGGEGMSVLADTFLEDTEICCSHQQFLWGSRDSLPDGLLSAIASVDPGRSARTHTAGPGEHSGAQKRMTLLFKLHLRSRSRQGADYTHTAVWGAGCPQPLRVGVFLYLHRAMLTFGPDKSTGPSSPLFSSLAAGSPNLPQGRGLATAAGSAPEPAGAGEGSGLSRPCRCWRRCW